MIDYVTQPTPEEEAELGNSPMKLSDLIGMVVTKTDVSSKGDILITFESKKRKGKEIIKTTTQVIVHENAFFDEDGMFIEVDR